MNRLSTAPKSHSTNLALQAETDFESGATHGSSDCSLFSPIHYESNYAYPLLVWLHGDGESQRQVQEVAPLISLRNLVAVGPCGVEGFDARDSAWPAAEEFAAENQIFRAIEYAQQRYNVNPSRIFLSGEGSGGSMAIRVGLNHPTLFAGAISLGGSFPLGGRPFSDLQAARQLPLLFCYERDSESHPIDEVCEQMRLWHAAGLTVTLRQYPQGMSLTQQMLHDVNVWIMNVVTGETAAEQPPADSHFKSN